MEEQPSVSTSNSHSNVEANNSADIGTVDFDTTSQTRHLLRLAAMTEIPISMEEGEKEMGRKYSGEWICFEGSKYAWFEYLNLCILFDTG